MLSSRIMVASGIEGFGELFQCLDLNLDEDVLSADRRGLNQRCRDSAGRHDVVFLDQDPVIKTQSMVGAAAASDRVFLSQAQPRKGLACIDDARLRAVHGVDVEARDGGGGRKQLQEIECGTLGGQQGARVGFDLAQGLASSNRLSIAYLPADHGFRIKLAEAGVEPRGAPRVRRFPG
jgi:hypothetical protein